MIFQTQLLPRFLTAGLLGSALLLAACEEKETFLVGEREDIRSVLEDPALAAPLDQTDLTNKSRAISLGAARTNANWTHSIGTAKYRVSHPALRSTPQLAWSANIGDGDSRKLRITATSSATNGISNIE